MAMAVYNHEWCPLQIVNNFDWVYIKYCIVICSWLMRLNVLNNWTFMWWSFIKAGDSSVNLLFSKYFASANMGFAQEGSVLTGCKIFLVLIASFKKSVALELSYAYIYLIYRQILILILINPEQSLKGRCLFRPHVQFRRLLISNFLT